MLNRLMELPDLAPCLARAPVPGVSHELALSVLGAALAEQRLRGGVIQHLASGRLMGFGLSGFARGADVKERVRSGRSLVVDHLLAESQGSRVYLDPAQMVQVQRADELHLVMVAYHPVDLQDPLVMELLHAGHTGFRLLHEGYGLRGVWQEGLESDFEWTSAIGFQVKYRGIGAEGSSRWLYGAEREDVPASFPSHTLSYVMHRRERRLHLSPAQCRVAELALWNLDDEQVATRLRISPATVRRHWRGIFERVDTIGALRGDGGGKASPMAASSVSSAEQRGPERRRKVLDYLRTHLQEIRPA
ncbi:hypothetical protein [Hydrogenophaga sp.]|uniref:helix-turn-helix transcriptional regulator n=1 Tax=Hydrogenophaga sp. TaxID=1904254 RepID=UPI00260C96B1|nr:hypothetical protein [Hydrogenophaga sp.]MDM7951105.1 hypothetical protein [Hydrogenophaga sp.]